MRGNVEEKVVRGVVAVSETQSPAVDVDLRDRSSRVVRDAARLDELAPLPPAGNGVQPGEVGLTERQAQVLALLVRGLSNREIGDTLELSEGTVKIHVTAIFKALGVASRTQALVAVARYGIDFGKVF